MNKKNIIFAVNCTLIFALPKLQGIDEEFGGRLGARTISQKGIFTLQNTFIYTKAKKNKEFTLETEGSYGFTEAIGIKFLVPFFLENKRSGKNSKGLGDVLPTVEWKFFDKGVNSALLTGGIELPTGSINKKPTTGSGTYDINLEFTALHKSDKWYASFDTETLLPIPRKGRKPGKQFSYELTFGRVFRFPNSSTSLFFVNLDLYGSFSQQNKKDGITIENSGGNVIFCGPLISWSHKNLTLEFLFEWPIGQHLFGKQPLFDYTTFFSFVLTF